MVYEPLHHKYRPQTFGQLIGQNAIATTLGNALRQGRIAPAYLFCGPRGTGKTSSARILAKSLNCMVQDHPTPEPCGTCETCRSITNGSALDFIEIDAASNTGVDNIRELIERAQFAPVQCRYKVYVIDECHMLSIAAFNALLKTLEEPPARVVFVLATTDPQRVLPTIISRCQRFDYRRIPLEPMVAHLQAIAQAEAIAIEETALRLVAQVSQGGLRDAQSLLDQLSLLEPPVSTETVWDLVGAVPERDLLALAQAILTADSAVLLHQARKLMDRGREPLIVLQNLAGFYRDLLIAKTAPDRQDLVAVTPPTWTEMQSLVAELDPACLLIGQQHLRSAEVQVKNTTQPRLWLEVTLLGLLPASIAPAPTLIEPSARGIAMARSTPETAATPSRPAVPSLSVAPPIAGDLKSDSEELGDRSSPPTLESAPSSSVAPATVTPVPDQTGSLDLLWARVIAVLEPLGTRALMQQQGSLLFLEGTVARIGINSRPLFKMAQGRVDNIAIAFEKVLGRKVQVSLEVLPDPKPEALVAPLRSPPDQAVPAASPPPPTDAAIPPPPVIPGPDGAEPRPTPSPTLEITTDFDRAVKTFAQFFNGQVVDLGDDLNWLTEGPLQPSEAGARQPSHPDKDVPF